MWRALANPVRRRILDLLRSELETGDIPRKTKIVYWLQSLFGRALPPTTKASYADEQGW